MITYLRKLIKEYAMKKRLLIIICALVFTLCGCSNPEEDKMLAVYKANMEQFFKNTETLNDNINMINPEDEGAKDELLGYLDSLNSNFEQMAQLQVPDDLDVLSKLALNASNDMKEAVKLYKIAYNGEYSSVDAETAYLFYKRANSELQSMIKIMHGEYNLTTDSDVQTNAYEIETEEIQSPPEPDEFDYDEDYVCENPIDDGIVVEEEN